MLADLIAAVKKAPPKLRKVGGIGLLILLVATLSIIIIHKISYEHEKNKLEAEAKAGPKVRISPVTMSDGDHVVMTTGEAVPFTTVTLYAKISGYLGSILVDKGDVVKKGQKLATIESPETDQDYYGAKSDYVNRADISKRLDTLIKQDLISPQEYEQARSDADMARSRYLAAQTLKNYETLVAPFDGTVTARFVDPGALIQSAQNGQSGALPVVTLSQIDVLRTYIYLDQRDATFVSPETPVKITLAERPGFELPARVSRIAGELDPKTRTMMVEIDIDNANNAIVAGSFVTVAIPIHSPQMLEAPVEALVNIDNKTMVPVVKEDNTIQYQEVTVASNDGKNVGILSGVQEGQVLALNLGANVSQGAKVRPISPDQQAQEDKNKKKGGSSAGSENSNDQKSGQKSGQKSNDGSGQKKGDGSAAPASSPKLIQTGGSLPVGDATGLKNPPINPSWPSPMPSPKPMIKPTVQDHP